MADFNISELLKALPNQTTYTQQQLIDGYTIGLTSGMAQIQLWFKLSLVFATITLLIEGLLRWNLFKNETAIYILERARSVSIALTFIFIGNIYFSQFNWFRGF